MSLMSPDPAHPEMQTLRSLRCECELGVAARLCMAALAAQLATWYVTKVMQRVHVCVCV